MASSSKQTPLMKQYNQIKGKYPDAMLLFRVGDFYETFGQDAVKASKILGIILTKKNNGGANSELAGFPYHSIDTYLPKLVKAGCRVAICDQLEDPKKTKTIVKRGVTELVTPGITTNDSILESKNSNFLCAIYFDDTCTGVSFLDISTGEFLTSMGSIEHVDKLVQSFSPREILISKTQKQKYKALFQGSYNSFYLEDWIFKEDFTRELLNNHFHTKSLKGFGIEDLKHGIIASGVILHYLLETHHNKLAHINTINQILDDEYMWMDRFTLRNLELCQRHSSYEKRNISLLEVLDYTETPMGARLLKRRITLPFKNLAKIKAAIDGVSYLVKHKDILRDLRSHLKNVSDLERLVSKIATGKISPRDVVYLKNTLRIITPLKKSISVTKENSVKLYELSNSLDDCQELSQHIEKAISDDAPALLQKGGVIKIGYNQELDDLRVLMSSGKAYLEKMLQREISSTGISSLKISTNNIFGYYIEVRHVHKDKVPKDWIRKQTLVNAERYITEELKTYEAKILDAESRVGTLEQNLFIALIEHLSKYIRVIKSNAEALAEIDLVCSFAEASILNRYSEPILDNSYELSIKNGRHPVIEKQLEHDKSYIANDINLDREQQQIIIITGPNMSGKSAILRQAALIVIMAQIGCFVPADYARIGLVDKIFTRVGASDNISMGESTFMVEMNEAASILNNISDRSLVLLDEIGRGTSTYDGISIAWSITEYLANHPTRPKTFFATHYHELNEMTHLFPRIKNFNVSVKESADKILFLRKLKEGGSHHSFGIHVAKMSGMPQQVIKRAEEILSNLEKTHQSQGLKKSLKSLKQNMQLTLFETTDPATEQIKKELLDLDLNVITPVELLLKVNELQRKMKLTKNNAKS